MKKKKMLLLINRSTKKDRSTTSWLVEFKDWRKHLEELTEDGENDLSQLSLSIDSIDVIEDEEGKIYIDTEILQFKNSGLFITSEVVSDVAFAKSK